mmetsp:Transcript_8495/g.18304  ORF Transcript_8495/g.18304 Transcript_8495/m.18304 type:complete len:486 (-) Transcript_8495:1356-2813(-)|eukprot:CAMPEP_0168250906 /NCGR_PEP_ID=MMETSP0141_2-20121125/2789_1 /TAXON_ID=44445 /ORGANISM="Pseudo-nitzschia australis, Strain 10249 10 AB" /LENGTH=485 /DNA_ID=CAMNT_0008187007 /DNA_START=41 /DNA_END=1498 /DNA_ORIENTATION=+
MLQENDQHPFSFRGDGRYEYDANFSMEEEIIFSMEDVESDEEVPMNVALSNIDRDYDHFLDESETPILNCRAKRQRKVSCGFFGLLTAIGIGLITLGWKVKKEYDKEVFLGNALKLKEESRHTISCRRKKSNLTFDQWMGQDMKNITALCDPEFPNQSNKVDASSHRPIKVFIMMGEANMVGAGLIHGDFEGSLEYTVSEKKRFTHLRNNEKYSSGRRWNSRNDVRYVAVREDFDVYEDGWLGIEDERNYFGLEQQFGYVMGAILDEPVLIIKSALGHNSLGGEILPPTSKEYEKDGFIYPGYGGSPQRWRNDGHPIEDRHWHAGMKYNEYVGNVKKVLHSIYKYYPGGSTYEIAGFVWWQGDSDRRASAYTEKYEENLRRLIHTLRLDFQAPKAKFVAASLGQDGYDMNKNTALVFQAQMNLASYAKYPSHVGHVATVDTRAAWRGPLHPGNEDNYDSAHYGNNAETFMEVGNAIGLAMAKLLF